LCRLASAHGILLLPGLEISTVHEGRKYHVLGYGAGVLDQEFAAYAFRPTAIKNETYRAVLQQLRADGAVLPSTEDILAGVRPDAAPLHPTKWMLSATLIGRYLAVARRIDERRATAEIKGRYNELKDRWPDRYVPTSRTVAMVREVGCIPVIAHPFWECTSGRNSWAGVLDDLSAFARLGLVGVEVSSRHDSPADEDRRRQAIEALGLVPFRSSDFHGNGKTTVGQFPMPVTDLARAAEHCGTDLALAIA
jgi:predicted metal-dependent phosphoesterase TrpH